MLDLGTNLMFLRSNKLYEFPPLTVQDIIHILAALFDNIFAPSTIAPTASAIAFGHNLFSYPDPTGSFLVRRFLKGTSNLSSHADTRLSITFCCEEVD